MDLISKLDLEKAQLQRVAQSAPSKLWSPSKGTDALTVPELQKRLVQETAQRQQVRPTSVLCLAVAAVQASGGYC